MKSILPTNKSECYICGEYGPTEEHHIFGGSNRKISEQNGFKVDLCHFCHNEPPFGVHYNRKQSDALKKECQLKYEETHSHNEFMGLIGKNYI
jgi:hypothetical protein